MEFARSLAAWAVATLVGLAWSVRKRTGLLDFEKFQDVFNELLRTKLNANRRAVGATLLTEQVVRFRDVARSSPGCKPLKITVTDLSRNRVVVFSPDDTPDVPVAAAVAASAAVPLLFRPVEIPWADGDPGPVYVDGGVSANLPVWVFDQERRADARRFGTVLPVIGFGFAERARPGAPVRLSLGELLTRVASASLSTGQSVTRDFIDDLVVVPLPCRLEMLDLDAGVERVVEAFRAAEAFTYARLAYVFDRRPRAIEAALRAFRDEAVGLLRPGSASHVRVCAIEPIRSRYGRAEPRNFRVTATCNFGGDADDRLTLDAENAGAPKAFRDQKETLLRDAAGLKAPVDGEHYMTKYERALVRPSLASALSIPVFADEQNWSRAPHDRDEPLGIVSIDSDSDLTGQLQDERVLRELTRKTFLLVDVFKE